jgi:hypothetical protein
MAPRPAVDSALDWGFFVLGGLAAIWFAWILFRESFGLGWGQIAFVVVFWLLIAYLVLPRLHRILTRIYVPDYFIGRARTSDGLLGDPVNLALLGGEAQLHATMLAAGWTRADDLSLATGLRIVRSTLLRRSYLEAPVSPLLLFGRKQDFAYQQEVDGSPGKRHHVRFWRCPDGWLLPGGHRADWLAAGTYDRSVGFSLFTLQITHKIESDTDVERDHIVSTIVAAEPATAVRTIVDFSAGYHSRNGGGDSIETDGDLPIVDLRAVEAGPATAASPTDSRDRRPAPIIVGALFLVVRALVAIALAIAIAGNADSVDELTGIEEGAALSAAILGVVVVLVAFGLVDLLVAWFVFLGRNGARVFAMTLSAISLVAQVITIETAQSRVALESSLPGIAVDVLLLLALSSERALVYAQRRRKAPKRISGRPGDVAAI